MSPACSLLSLTVPQRLEAKTGRVRTNYKLRVGEHLEIGRYTPYSQVRIPFTGSFVSDDTRRYYRHAKVHTSGRSWHVHTHSAPIRTQCWTAVLRKQSVHRHRESYFGEVLNLCDAFLGFYSSGSCDRCLGGACVSKVLPTFVGCLCLADRRISRLFCRP